MDASLDDEVEHLRYMVRVATTAYDMLLDMHVRDMRALRKTIDDQKVRIAHLECDVFRYRSQWGPR